MMFLAKLFEENSAGGSLVHLQFDINKLMIYSQKGQFLFSWHYSDIHQSQCFIPPAPACFTQQNNAQHMLVIEDKYLYQEMMNRIQKGMKWRDIIKKHASIFIISFLIILSTAGMYFYGVKVLARFVPWDMQKYIGKRVLLDIIDQYPIDTDPVANQLLAKIYNPIIKVAKLKHPATILIIKNSHKNAVALPGGYILVYSGLIKHIKDPRAIAGVLAHEIAHVKYQHNIQGMSRSLTTQLILVSTLGYNQTEIGAEVLINSKFSREFEQQADDAAIDYLGQLNIRTKPFADFFNTITKEDNWLTFASTHPNTKNRIKVLLEHDNSRNNRQLLSSGEWLLMQKRLT